MQRFIDHTFDEERALYHLTDIEVINCRFDGIRDGESAIKECSNVIVKNSFFNLRYVLWCLNKADISNIELTSLARSSLWYCNDVDIKNSKINCVKAFRMCNNITIKNCTINSIEFGWNCNNVVFEDNVIDSEYPFLRASNVKVKNCIFNTKYPFQQAKHIIIENTTIDAKDAFWDSEDITCINCKITGDFLAWYCNGLTLINCEIISSQPLCYINNLRVVDCKMEKCDLAFEYSNVHAKIKGNIISIKNPQSGEIIADSINEIIVGGNSVYESNAKIIDLSKTNK